ncbi:MAG: exonuclease V subunit alpha [Solidesulfovibrio sp. DCME]|uniref:exonuclease V subunit alpha n=1 Tax=Solidesulfovibrio sp. DCME TaxID=3447380 RepID=UPI003D0DF42C
MPHSDAGLFDTAAYAEALAFARSLRDPGKPLDFPSYSDYVRLVAERVVIDLDAFDPDMADFHELPETYELAYLTARLERLRARIAAERGLDVSVL